MVPIADPEAGGVLGGVYIPQVFRATPWTCIEYADTDYGGRRHPELGGVWVQQRHLYQRHALPWVSLGTSTGTGRNRLFVRSTRY